MTGGRPQMSLPRYHSLDRLRASMMMLGVVRHAAMSYEPTVFEWWPYKDAQSDILAQWVIVFIRVFQVPVFFAIAGFFAAYLAQMRGIRGFLSHRWSRIGVPLLVAWPVMGVTMYFCLIFVSQFSPIPLSYTHNVAELASDRAPRYILMHLWFLYHLIILCVVASGLLLLAARIPESIRSRVIKLLEHLVHRGGILVLAVIGGVILFQMRSWEIDYSGNLLPPLRLLALWGLFFAFGWLLFWRRETLERFKRPAWIYFAAGIACFFVYRFFSDAGCHAGADRVCTGTSEIHHLGTVAFLSLSMWFMAYGLIGLFLRYMDKPSPRWRYMADASYWIYIVHVPIVMLLPILLTNVPLPGIVKLGLVSVMATGLILVTYRYFVRPTFIGKQLNGQRYPRGATWG